MGDLQEHANSVSCVEFWGGTTLVTADDDGQVCVWRASDWELLLKFRAHKVALSCIAVHPSGKVMASAGRDKNIRLWDLTRGTSASTLSMEGDAPETLLWSPSGGLISALNQKQLIVVRANTGVKADYRDPNSSGLTRISLNAMLYLDDSTILLGDGKGDLRVLAVNDATSSIVETHRLPEDRARGRCKMLFRGGGTGGGPGGAFADGWFAAGFSSGIVEVWSCEAPAKAKDLPNFRLLRSVDTKIRLTCMAVWPGPSAASEQIVATAGKKVATTAAVTKKAETTAAAIPKEAADDGSKRKKKKRRGAQAAASS